MPVHVVIAHAQEHTQHMATEGTALVCFLLAHSVPSPESCWVRVGICLLSAMEGNVGRALVISKLGAEAIPTTAPIHGENLLS